jgi:hypothetical protein
MEVIITFGQVHVHRVNNTTFDKDCVAVITCLDYEDGRIKAFALFDTKWHNCVPRKEWNELSMKYYPRGYLKAN